MSIYTIFQMFISSISYSKFAITANVKQCLNEKCQIVMQKLTNAPACEWKHFRDWALMLMSCQMNSKNQGSDAESWKWGRVVWNFYIVAQSTRSDKMIASVDLFETCELINWMLAVNAYIHPSYKPQSPVRTHISEQKLTEAIQTAEKSGICRNRLWNLTIGGGEREEVDLPVFMKTVGAHSAQFMDYSGHENHHACTAEVCCLSNIDSTRVKQLHKCSTGDCGEPLSFPTSELGKNYRRVTWWIDDIDGAENLPYVVQESQTQYMAISHVWSDGTGVGIQGDGRVNRCLFEYFRGVAKELKCKAIWWDTICIPTERTARQIAISRIQETFQEAAHTVIHDQCLTHFPWSEDGSPCLALLLSPWFTRAWTSLELLMSKKGRVSVLYRHDDNTDRYVVKNLDNEVLALHPAYTS
jgi:hypothetical protein